MVAVQEHVNGHTPSFRLPLIDLSGLSDPIRRASICAQVAQASENIGFFEVVNSGVPQEAMDDAFAINQEFFDLPVEEKLSLRVDNENVKRLIGFQLGYKQFAITQGIENKMEELVFRDYHLKPRDPPEHTYANYYKGPVDPMTNWWPVNPVSYREKVERFSAELGKLTDTLLDVFSESLGLPPSYIRLEHHSNATAPRYLHFHHFPKTTRPAVEETGLLPHKDSSVFTLVCQTDGEKGLQLKQEGGWIDVMPQRGGILVNVGDILEAWSNSRYKSIIHRVVCNHATGRTSLAYFCFPSGLSSAAECVIKPIDALITKENPATYEPFTFLEFFNKKLAKNSLSLLQTAKVRS